MFERLKARRAAQRNCCRIDEEWQGAFIGRRYCRTHGYRWDTPSERPCPGHSQPADDLHEGTWT